MLALILGVVVMDPGVQSSQAANQARVYPPDPTAGGRLDTIFMGAMLLGGSLGVGAAGNLALMASNGLSSA